MRATCGEIDAGCGASGVHVSIVMTGPGNGKRVATTQLKMQPQQVVERAQGVRVSTHRGMKLHIAYVHNWN